jgi:predicted Zn-dependent protease
LAMKATIALRKNNSAVALDFATRAQKTAPAAVWANVLLAQALDASSRQTEAIAVLNRYLTSNPDSRYARQWRARLYEKNGDAQKALKDYDLLVELRKGDLTAYVRVAEAKMAEKSEKAIAIMQDATRLYPRSSWAWATYGYMLLQTGEKAKARVAIEKAVKLDPANANYGKLLNSIPAR